MPARRVLAALLLASRADALSTASVLRKISPLHVDRYEREGVVVVRGLVDADAVELLRREVDGAVAVDTVAMPRYTTGARVDL